ncbi:HAD family hydrolase [Streptomyces cahuitamycinicus]|uniref:Hydrolase n=1 Tax=Streptomyces cahuitamycinicus TaxID=2070367 RepID=A0A2N8TWA8_9ACTN|nr:HAD-IA family hydrolase [Streptomyces cahuitamycinicus]PNG23286.1 hydrolase [Streptomyces cahuitamycinicus]
MTLINTCGRPFDAVLCDLDNVIRFYDLTRLAGLEQLAGLAEGTTTRVAYAPETDLPLLLGKIGKEEWVETIVRGLVGEVSEPQARVLGTALAEAPFRADDVAVTMLRRIREHMPLVLVTNATLELENDLESLGLSDLADHVVSSARVGVAKPDREIYEIAAARAETDIERCLFVDDRLENIEAAVALGMTGVHYREPEDLRRVLAFALED